MKKRTKYIIGFLLGTTLILATLSSFFNLSMKMAPMAPPPGPAPPDSDPLYKIDRILERMDFGNISFNTPHSLNINESALIHLVLGVEKTIDTLKKL